MLWLCWQWSCMSNLYETPAACFTGPAPLSFHCPHGNISSLVIPANLTAWPHGQSVTWAVLHLSTLATLPWKAATFFAVPGKTKTEIYADPLHTPTSTDHYQVKLLLHLILVFQFWSFCYVESRYWDLAGFHCDFFTFFSLHFLLKFLDDKNY